MLLLTEYFLFSDLDRVRAGEPQGEIFSSIQFSLNPNKSQQLLSFLLISHLNLNALKLWLSQRFE